MKKETLAQVFSYEFCEISKNTFFTEHLWTTASVQTGLSQRKSNLRLTFFSQCLVDVIKLVTHVCPNVSPKTFYTLVTSSWASDIATSVFASQFFHCLPNQHIFSSFNKDKSINDKLNNAYFANVLF